MFSDIRLLTMNPAITFKKTDNDCGQVVHTRVSVLSIVNNYTCFTWLIITENNDLTAS